MRERDICPGEDGQKFVANSVGVVALASPAAELKEEEEED
jgi:hypothetical protein